MFFIVNCTDRPHARHVCQTIDEKAGTMEYLHEDLRGWGTLKHGKQTTPIVDFGFQIEIGLDGIASFKQAGESKAVYTDGSPRKWQGEAQFKLRMK